MAKALHGLGKRVITSVQCFPYSRGSPGLFWIIEGFGYVLYNQRKQAVKDISLSSDCKRCPQAYLAALRWKQNKNQQSSPERSEREAGGGGYSSCPLV